METLPSNVTTLPTTQGVPQELADLTTDAIMRAMMAATIIITRAKNRPLNSSDETVLAAAGMSGFDSAIFRVVGEQEYSEELRAIAIYTWSEERQKIVKATRHTARTLCR